VSSLSLAKACKHCSSPWALVGGELLWPLGSLVSSQGTALKDEWGEGLLSLSFQLWECPLLDWLWWSWKREGTPSHSKMTPFHNLT
jgi:hypothetical protein